MSQAGSAVETERGFLLLTVDKVFLAIFWARCSFLFGEDPTLDSLRLEDERRTLQ